MFPRSLQYGKNKSIVVTIYRCHHESVNGDENATTAQFLWSRRGGKHTYTTRQAEIACCLRLIGRYNLLDVVTNALSQCSISKLQGTNAAFFSSLFHKNKHLKCIHIHGKLYNGPRAKRQVYYEIRSSDWVTSIWWQLKLAKRIVWDVILCRQFLMLCLCVLCAFKSSNMYNSRTFTFSKGWEAYQLVLFLGKKISIDTRWNIKELFHRWFSFTSAIRRDVWRLAQDTRKTTLPKCKFPQFELRPMFQNGILEISLIAFSIFVIYIYISLFVN